MRRSGFTLVELLVTVAIIAILSAAAVVAINPLQRLQDSRYASTKFALEEIANAAHLYANDNGAWAADVNRGIPSQFSKYISPAEWAKGPFPGSVFDWDNWEGQTCWDGTSGGIQVSLRQVNGYNGHDNYVIYYVIEGQGIPHCSDSTARGECINCVSRYP